MNTVKRARLKDAVAHLKNLHEIMEEIRDEEQNDFDALSEGLKVAPNGLEMEEAIDVLDPIVNNLEEAIDELSIFLGLDDDDDPSA